MMMVHVRTEVDEVYRTVSVARFFRDMMMEEVVIKSVGSRIRFQLLDFLEI